MAVYKLAHNTKPKINTKFPPIELQQISQRVKGEEKRKNSISQSILPRNGRKRIENGIAIPRKRKL